MTSITEHQRDHDHVEFANVYIDNDGDLRDGGCRCPHCRLMLAGNAGSGTAAKQPLAPRVHGDAQDRKNAPLVSGCLDYFPDALMEVARLSKKGNDQHNPGEPLHWARGKSADEADCILRHLIDRGAFDTDGVRHSAKVAWRALALLQKELEEAYGLPCSRGSKPATQTPQS